ncbi:DNA-binding response regulator [Bosea caraganae]|uniref:DNA-binding response regulator n=1 Tax=Bosea caraganae TaxID=2763117 RepID=A0A370LCX3_9HYPH|nr:response regulator [Bosea caraganae]RDJ27793.1 DNA-binding response regulator [Bosea caraganae]RDJ29806.1 DNA-binding response regulator [Bosea caraganae]
MPQTILCVEDEVDLRGDIVEELEAAGYAVLEAGNGEDALALLAKAKPDLILCDITMPGMSGFEILPRLRKAQPDYEEVPFIYLTALAGRSDMVQGRKLGADDYLVKPIDYDLLLATIRTRLDRVGRLRQSFNASFESQRRSIVETALSDAKLALNGVASALDKVGRGIVVFDRRGLVSLINDTARAIAAEGDAVILANGQLRGIQQAGAKALALALDEALGLEGQVSLVLAERDFRHPLAIQIYGIPMPESGDGPAAIAFLIDPEQRPPVSAEIIRRMYGLTVTEARVGVALASGRRLEEVADDMAIAQTTVAYHLRNIFRKTNTARQADLIMLLMQSSLYVAAP